MQPDVNTTIQKYKAQFQQNLGSDVSSIGQFATTYNAGPIASPQQGTLKTFSSGSQSNVGKLAHFIGTVGKEAGGIIGGVGKFAVKAAIDTVTAPIVLGQGMFNAHDASVRSSHLSAQGNMLSQQTKRTIQDYKAGRITQEQYKQQLQELAQQSGDLTRAQTDNMSLLDKAGKQLSKGGVNTAADVIAVMTAGAAIPLEAAIADKGTSAAVDLLTKGPLGDAFISSAAKIDQLTKGLGTVTSKVTGVENSFSLQTMDQIAKEAAATAGNNLTSRQIAKNVAVNLFLKKPLIYQTTVNSAADAYKELASGKFGSGVGNVALLASMALEGGPLGFALKQASKGGSWLKSAMFSGGDPRELLNELTTNATKNVSRQSFIDALSSQVGDKDLSGIYKELQSRLENGDVESYQMMKVMEDINMRQAKGNSVVAANNIIDYLNSLDGGKAVSEMTPGQLIDSLTSWAKTRQAMVEAAKAGKILSVDSKDAERIVLGRANISDLNFIQQVMRQADEQVGVGLQERVQARQAALQGLIEQYGQTAAWANSDSFLKQMGAIIVRNHDTQAMVNALNDINLGEELAGVPKELQEMARKNGFIAVLPKKGADVTPHVTYDQTSKTLRTAFAKEVPDSNLFIQAVKPVPVLQSVGSFLSRIGLSPESSGDVTQSIFKQNLQQVLPKELVSVSGESAEQSVDSITQKLSNFIKGKTGGMPIVDYRQMRLKEVQEALGVSEATAKEVAGALNTAMLKVPLQIRGLGDRLMDLNYAKNPLASGYARLQGSARFTYNPFFRWQQTTQTEFLSQLEAGGKRVSYPGWNKVNAMLFPGKQVEIDNTVSLLEQNKIFGSGFSGQMSDTAAAGAEAISTRLLKGEKQSLAGLVNTMASKVGMSAPDFVEQYRPQVIDALRTIVQYPTHDGFLNSPLARTINFAFFPFRYNMKVAGLMAEQLSRLSAPMQVALVKNLFEMNSFLNSDEGQAWYSQHAEAIKLFQWLSPLYPLNYVQRILTDVGTGEVQVGDLGQLGGLPFGFIGQMLDANNIIHLNAPYVDPASGNILPKYIPKSLKAQANLAIQDLLGQTFSYPGATAGLPSKGSIERSIVGGLLPGSNKEFEKVDQTGNVTAKQKHQAEIYRQTRGGVTAANGTQVNLWQEGASIPSALVVPAQGDINPAPIYKSGRSSSRKKKSEFIPEPLPNEPSLV